MREMPVGAVKVIRQIGAAFATFVPVGTEHEMINDQLTAPVEKIGQGFLAIRPFEYVILVDLHHREAPSGGAERIALASKFFFSRQQVLSRHEPLSFGHDLSIQFRFC